jgi:tetratricopeptide (TPR) repeat protein
MRIAILMWMVAALAFCQEAIPTPERPAETTAPAIPVITVSIAPLAAPDLDSPYASPRDAARHRLQATLSDLGVNRDIKEAVRGFGQAFLLDRTYAAAAFDLGVVAAIAEKWEDALGAFEEVQRLDPRGLGVTIAPQLERVRLLATLESSAEGRRKRRYDEALLSLLDKLPRMQHGAAQSALADLGRIDPQRWEAPAMLAGLDDAQGYEAAAKFLEIAATNAGSASGNNGVKSALETALKAAERELRYSSALAAAETAADGGEYTKAAELYQTAWTTIPARTGTGLNAVSSLLLSDDTGHASTLLLRLRDSSDTGVNGVAGAMLKELEPIEPAAKATASDAAQFFKDSGPREPVRIATLIPPVDRKPFEIYTRPLPKLVEDAEPVVLLASLAADKPADQAPAMLPVVPAPSIAGDHPWREIRSISGVPAPAPRAVQNVDLAANAASRGILSITTEPAGARVFIGETAEPACETPCKAQLADGTYSIRFSKPGFQDEQRSVEMTSSQDLAVPLTYLRGSVIVESPSPAAIRVNGTPVGAQTPAELSFVPGLYRISAEFGSATRDRVLMIKPGARLRL